SGAMAGLAVSATFACVMPGLDYLPRLVWKGLASATGWANVAGRAWLWTPLWIILATLGWTIIGAVAGFVLGCLGHAGASALSFTGAVLATILRVLGLKRAAGYFAAQ